MNTVEYKKDIPFSMTIDATTDDLYKFQYTLSNRNKIYKFWINIYKNASKNLKLELKQKSTTLYSTEKPKEFKFMTFKASNELEDYLNQFTVIVKDV